jgi:hypothetical protein
MASGTSCGNLFHLGVVAAATASMLHEFGLSASAAVIDILQVCVDFRRGLRPASRPNRWAEGQLGGIWGGCWEGERGPMTGVTCGVGDLIAFSIV